MGNEIYLDYAATTPVRQEVVDSMMGVWTQSFGNPSSLHNKGVQSESLVNKARSQVASSLGARPSEIVFTSGGTEANNLAILGTARQYASRGNHIISAQSEHASVRDPLAYLEKQGFRVTYLPIDQMGNIRVDDLGDALTSETILVSLMYVNNETGVINPIQQIGKLLADYRKTLFHVDAVQAFGKTPISVKHLGVDLVSVSAHKIYGPKGVGVLYIRDGVHLTPLLFGGGQEKGVRSGTENVPGIVGLGTAAELAVAELPVQHAHYQALHTRFVDGLREKFDDIHISSSTGAPYILNVSFPGVKAEVLVHMLELSNIYISTGAACSSKDNIHSHVLRAMGLPRPLLDSAVRFSLGKETTMEDIDKTIDVLTTSVTDIRSMTRR